MFKKVKSKITSSEEKKQLVSNVLSLGVLQCANYILPLLTLPYLVRVLGPEYFGLLAFATATIGYFTLISNYGFNLSATREISIYRDDPNKINEIFSSVMIVKTLLMLLCFFLMCLLVFSFDRFSKHWDVYFMTFGMVVGQVYFPIWFFQGMEKMKYIVCLNLFSKSLFTVCVFLLVEDKNDYLLVPLLTFLGFLVSGGGALFLVKKDFKVKFFWQPLGVLKKQLIDGWYVFLSSFSISLYTVSVVFILGIFTNNAVVGHYSAADKLIQAIKGFYTPVSQAIFPLIGRKMKKDKIGGLVFVRKVTWFVGAGMFFVSIIVYFSSTFIIDVLFGENYQESIFLLKLMAFLPFIIVLSNMYGVQTMLNLGLKKLFSQILISAALIGCVLSFLFIPKYEALGAVFVVLIVEIFVTLTMFLSLRKLKK